MGKQTRSKKSEAIGKGKVTPTQVAYIVDRYLCDNNYSQTRSLFRTEASSLIFNSPPEAPKSLLSLGAILDDYITLKEEKVTLGHERARLEQEKLRVHSLLQGMQEVMNAYNAGAALTPPPSVIHSSVTGPNFPATQPDPRSVSSAGCTMYQSAVVPASMPLSTAICQQNMSTATVNPSVTRKRMSSNAAVDGTSAAKKTRSSSRKLPTGKTEVKGQQKESPANGSPTNNVTGNAVVVGVAGTGCFVDQPAQSHQTPASSSSPITPPTVKNSGVSSIGLSPNPHCGNNNSPQDISPTSCTVVTAERVIVSPCKKFAYLERSQEISSSSPVKTTLTRVSKREFIKGRLDFDCSDAATSSDKQQVDNIPVPESAHDADFFDIDFPNLDELGPNFSFAELLTELDLGGEGFGCNSQPILGASVDNVSGSSPEYEEGNFVSDQGTPEVI